MDEELTDEQYRILHIKRKIGGLAKELYSIAESEDKLTDYGHITDERFSSAKIDKQKAFTILAIILNGIDGVD